MAEAAELGRHPSAPLDTGRLSTGTAVAVSPHHLASRAAIDTMQEGGNAVDGAIAANAVLGVVAPDTCGIGGDLFAMVHRWGDATPLALNSSGRAGSGTTAAQLRASGLDRIPDHGPLAITVPGCVDGWGALQEALGRLPLARTLRSAISHAENGFEVSRELAASLSRVESHIASQPSAAPLYPDGPAREGQIVRRPRLAAALRAIAAEGRDAFYLGEVGDAITDVTDGAITARDLEIDQAEWIDPIGLDVFGHRAWTIPPNSQGYLALATAWIVEHLDWSRDPDDPLFTHAVVEAYRAMAWEREDFVSDPTTAPLSAHELLDTNRLAGRASKLHVDSATPWPRPSPAPGGTAYLCVVDAEGTGVSLIQSNFHGIGSRISAGDTGVFLHNRGAGFTLLEGHPNEYTPGRRPLHTLSPTLWTKGDRLALLLGTRGGQYQPQLLAQAAATHLWAGDTLPSVQDRPRWLLTGWARGDHARLWLEQRTSGAITAGVQSRGHDVAHADAWMPAWGPISMISTADGVQGAADPRVSTAAAVR